MRTIFRRLMYWTRRRQHERDLAEELETHRSLRQARLEASGLRAREAAQASRRAIGNVTLALEDVRDIWVWRWLRDFNGDLRHGIRLLRRSPSFTSVAVVSLALGIGANTAIFSLLNVVVLRPLPVADPHQLVQFTYTAPNDWNSWFGYPQLERFRAEAKTLSGVFGSTGLGRVSVAFRGTSRLGQGDACTDNFFAVLGVRPQYGRFFSVEDDRADAAVAILSDRYWRTRWGADPSIVDHTVTINQMPFTVIGIAPAEFSDITVGSGPDLWVPLHALDRFTLDRTRWTASFTSWMLIGGRLRPGVSRAHAQAEADIIHRQLLAEQLSASESRGDSLQRFVRESHLVLRPAEQGMYSGLRNTYAFPLTLLMGVAGIVLLVACTNVANLLLARASNRRREIAVRLALGAGRARVMRQFFTETILLASIGGALALAIAWWGSAALVRMISTGDSPVPLDMRPDWRIFGFTAGVSLVTSLLIGLAPAVRGTRVDPGPTMNEGLRQVGPSSRALDRLLVIVQVALSFVLITGAGLFVRTLQNLSSVNLGYDREHVLMFSAAARLAGYSKDQAGAVYREILQRLQALPDVRSASASFERPVDDQLYLVSGVGDVDGRTLPQRIRVAWNAIGPGYFSTIVTPVLQGRDFDLRDTETAPKVVMVNESLASRALPGQNPIGHRLGEATIVGVVKDSHHNGVRDQPRPVLYFPLFQSELNFDVSFELRYSGGANLVDEVRREVSSVDRNLPIFRTKTLRTEAEQSLLRERLLAVLSSFFGALALLLASVGLYGLMAYAVARRTGEIGIRMALGARRDQIMWLVLRETLCLSLAGIASGVPLAFWTAQYAKSLLFGIGPTDALTMAGSVAALIGVAAVAGYVPALRAVRVDPMVALRYE
jgi:predicted permease